MRKYGKVFTAIVLIFAIAIPSMINIYDVAQLLIFPYDLINAAYGSFVAEAVVMADGGSIYTSPEQRPYITTAYPPIFSAVLSLAMPFHQMPMIAGRWAGAALLLLTSLIIAFFVARQTGDSVTGILAGLIPHIYSHDLLAHYIVYHAVVIAALVLTVLYREKPSTSKLLLLILAAASASWTRQTGLLMPVVITLVLADKSKMLALFAGGASMTLSVIFHVVLAAATHGEYSRGAFFEVGSHPLMMPLIYASLEYAAQSFVPLLGVLGLFLFSQGKKISEKTFFIAGVVTVLPALITSSKYGSDARHQITGYIILWIACLIFWGRSAGWKRVVVTLCLIIPAFYRVHPPRVVTEKHWNDGRHIQEMVSETDGYVLTDRHLGLLLPYKSPEYDVARTHEAWRNQEIEPHQLIQDIKDQRYDLIMSSRYYETTDVAKATDKYYEEVERIESPGPIFYRFIIMKPRTSSDRSAEETASIAAD